MMLGVSFGVAALSLQGRARSVSSPAIAPSIRAVFLGQSEIEYLFRADSTYQKISYDVPPTVPNLVVITQNGPGVAPVRTEVTAATIAAGHVNPAMAALSEFLAYAVPGRLFVIGDLAVQGTGRESLFNDSNTGRLWSDLTSVVDLIEGEFGPVQHMIECWYNADRTSISSFRNSFWPMYFGANGDGTEFELGTEGGTGTVVDQCIWDASALPDEKGRGVFARATTKWHILTPMPFASEVPNDSEMVSFSAGVGSLGESDRARLHALEDDSLAQSVNLRVGPSAHVTDFGGGIHPDVNSPDGQALFTWPFAVSLLRAAGNTVGEPRILDCEAPTDGTYADLIIDLPNGGELTTLRQFRGQAHPVNPSPHQQQVTGIEISRGAVIRPVFHTAETSYPTEFRGTVAIQDSGSGNPRRGRVRITPEQPFVSGDSLSYLRGRATGLLQKPRDVANKVYLDHLIEHVPAFFDDNAVHPFEGIAVQPGAANLTIPLPEPAFVARGATFAAADNYSSSTQNISGSNQGLLSFWIRQDGAWSGNTNLLDLRSNTNQDILIRTISSDRLRISLRAATGDVRFTSSNGVFSPNVWHHVLAAWDAETQRFQVYVNGIARSTEALDGTDLSVAFGITRVFIGTGSFAGSVAYMWLSINQTLDLSDPANREKFVKNGEPVDLGADGGRPTGVAPEWYYDGEGPDFINRGTVGNIPLSGGPLLAAPTPIP